MEVAGPLGAPLGLAQRKRASPRGEAATSHFLSVSDSDRRVPAELGQESQASSCLRKGTPLASRVAHGVSGPPSTCVWNPRVFADDAHNNGRSREVKGPKRTKAVTSQSWCGLEVRARRMLGAFVC